MKISGVYEIVNTITGDFYIGSTVDLERRKQQHFRESVWKHEPNKQLYKDMKQYGKNSFLFKPIWLCNPTELKKYEQIAIEKYNPKYNRYVAYTGMSMKEYMKQYYKENIDKIKQSYKENADSIKQQKKQYYKENTDSIKQKKKQYYNHKCLYENEILSLRALTLRFYRKGIEHPTIEAKKYLIE